MSPRSLQELAALYANAAHTDDPAQALERFTAVTSIDESACDAWVGRISHADYDRTTLFRAWYSRRNFGQLASAADLSVVSLNAWVPIGGGIARLRAPVTSPTALTAAYAIAEAAQAHAYDDALEVLAEADQCDLTAWSTAIVYCCGTRWDKVTETLLGHSWQDVVFKQCAELLHGVAAAHLGLEVEADRRLRAALTAEHSKMPSAETGAWYLAMVHRASGEDEQATAQLQWLKATYPSERVTRALEDRSYRLPVTTHEQLAGRADPWVDDAKVARGPVIRKQLLEEATEKLRRQIGLESVKEQIADYRASAQMAAVRATKGLKFNQDSRHMVFAGPPGTGKTTIAEVVALNLAGLGIIERAKVTYAVRKDLVAEFEGQTAPKTSRKIDEALDGVLFVDEFYSLVQERNGQPDPFGREAIDTLLARMENERDRLVVIIAGYPSDLDRALDSNDGLRGRFAVRIDFPSYTPDEIVEIADLIAGDNDSILADDAKIELRGAAERLAATTNSKGMSGLDIAGNGRFARKVVAAGERARDRRLSDSADIDSLAEISFEGNEIELITAEDMKAALQKLL